MADSPATIAPHLFHLAVFWLKRELGMHRQHRTAGFACNALFLVCGTFAPAGAPASHHSLTLPPLPCLTDEEIFRKTRLTVSAIVAKVHTIDWTVELLKNPILRTGMRANWYGIIGECNRVLSV